jgi:hypothetical protein
MSPRSFLLLLPASVLILIVAQSAIACSCGPRPGLLGSFAYSDEVVILRAVSVEKVENTPDRHNVNGVRSTTMVVEKVFKGNLKVGDQIPLPKVDELIAKGGADSVDVNSNKIEFKTEQNVYQVELTLPFPQCEKK